MSKTEYPIQTKIINKVEKNTEQITLSVIIDDDDELDVIWE